MTNHGTDGDISDGISVISDCDSICDRHSPMPMAYQKLGAADDKNELETNKTSAVECITSFNLVERSRDNELQALNSNNYAHPYSEWNPTVFLLCVLAFVTAFAIASRISLWQILPEMSAMTQRISDLESENLALKVEVNRLVELHHAGHDHSRIQEKVVEKRSVKQKKVWTGAGDTPVHIPKEPIKENYCKDEYLHSDDLFASYSSKKCENIDDLKKQKSQKFNSKEGSNNDGITVEDNSSQQFESRRKKNLTKDDSASIKREKFAESKFKNAENQRPSSASDENIRNDKFVKIQEERQKIFDEATQKYLERQKKMEKKQEKDQKYREEEKDKKPGESILKESKNSRKQPKDIDSEWYDKMMKQREALRAMDGTKQQNKENWYTDRANEREKVRGKREKQTKSKQYL